MPKMKTHKGIKKVMNVRPGGTVSIGKPGSRHNTGKKNTDFSRDSRAGGMLSDADKRRFKNIKY